MVLNPSEMPQEILILDAPTLEEAVNVWRWNSGGLGFSSSGYNGEYNLAMTMDGAINADFITAGIINGALVQADSVQSGAISQYYKAEVTNEIDFCLYSLVPFSYFHYSYINIEASHN